MSYNILCAVICLFRRRLTVLYTGCSKTFFIKTLRTFTFFVIRSVLCTNKWIISNSWRLWSFFKHVMAVGKPWDRLLGLTSFLLKRFRGLPPPPQEWNVWGMKLAAFPFTSEVKYEWSCNSTFSTCARAIYVYLQHLTCPVCRYRCCLSGRCVTNIKVITD